MSNDPDGQWIPFKERLPGHREAVWVCRVDEAPTFRRWITGESIPDTSTHWQPVQVPAPTPKERTRTQAEMDEAEFIHQHGERRNEREWRIQLGRWLDGIAWERAEVRAIIGGNAYELETDRTQVRLPVAVVDRLSRRVGLKLD